MSKRERLNKIAARQLESITSVERYVAGRMDIIVSAQAMLDRLEVEDYDIMDILAVAEFLAGDRVES